MAHPALLAHAGRPLALLCALGVVLAGAAPARTGSITASSIWDRDNALQRARDQMPAGATVTRERCEEIEVGMNNIRYRCTVWFEPAAPAESGEGAAGAAAS